MMIGLGTCPVAIQQPGDFTAQGQANLTWAFATLNESSVAIFTALAREAERRSSAPKRRSRG